MCSPDLLILNLFIYKSHETYVPKSHINAYLCLLLSAAGTMLLAETKIEYNSIKQQSTEATMKILREKLGLSTLMVTQQGKCANLKILLPQPFTAA